jgi:hypothetical protein
MTQEQFKKAVHDRQSHIKTLEKEIAELKNTYLNEHSDFEVGDKVTVIEKGLDGKIIQEHVAFVSGINTYDGGINYSFHKSKKDGTPSYNKLHVWGNRYEVKKLNSAPNVQERDATKDDSSTEAGSIN